MSTGFKPVELSRGAAFWLPAPHALGVATWLATFVLLLVGGMVHATGSSLACPDWPLCYGQVFPEMRGGVAVEHSHRLVASAVGLLTIGLALSIWQHRRGDRVARVLGWTCVALVIVQGVLGGITVLLRLPLAVSTAHLGVSFAFFGVLAVTVLRVWPRPLLPSSARVPIEVRRWAGATAIAVYVQALLGALVRHTGSAFACGGDWLLCEGNVWPGWGPSQLHMLHRIVALGVAALVVVTALRARKLATDAPLVTRLALAAIALVLVQIALGMASVATSIDVVVVTAHLGGAALLLACMVALRWACGRASA